MSYDEKFLSKNGTLPWYIQDMMVKLTNAFKEKKKTEILFIAADLAHLLCYIVACKRVNLRRF